MPADWLCPFYLQEKKSEILKSIGTIFVNAMPYIIKIIGVVGTIAMLAVGGGIIVHETHMLHSFDEIIKAIPMGGFLSEIIIGMIVGFISAKIVPVFSKLFKRSNS